MYQVDTKTSTLSTPACTAADSKPLADAAPAAAPVFIYVEAGSSSRCSSDSAAGIPHYPCSLQQHPELADATAADDVTQVAPAAAILAAAAKSKPAQLQFAECDTAAALAGLGDNMQQHSQQLHRLPATALSAEVVGTSGGKDGSKQSGWLRRVCSRMFACGAAGSMSRVDWV
jgi:hypothetical protein